MPSTPEQLIQRAEKLLAPPYGLWKIFSWFSSPHYEDAADLFIKAGNLYVMQRQDNYKEQAASCYFRAAGNYLQCDDEFIAMDSYKRASPLYLTMTPPNTRQALYCLQQVYNYYSSKGEWDRSGKYMMEIAEIHAGISGSDTQTITAYQDAANAFYLSKSWASYDACISKKATLLAQLGRFNEAAIAFRDLCDDISSAVSAGNKLRSYSLDEFVFCSICCYVIDGDLVSAERIYEKYHSRSGITGERIFLRNILNAVREEDVNMFQGALNDYNDTRVLDDRKIFLLLKIKERLNSNIVSLT